MSRTSLYHTWPGNAQGREHRALWDPLYPWMISRLSPHSVPSLSLLVGPRTPPSADMRPILSEQGPQILKVLRRRLGRPQSNLSAPGTLGANDMDRILCDPHCSEAGGPSCPHSGSSHWRLEKLGFPLFNDHEAAVSDQTSSCWECPRSTRGDASASPLMGGCLGLTAVVGLCKAPFVGGGSSPRPHSAPSL